MANKVYGRLRYDECNDSFVYEIRSEGNDWGMCMTAQCVRGEGAEEGDEANYVHYQILKKVFDDASMGVVMCW